MDTNVKKAVEHAERRVEEVSLALALFIESNAEDTDAIHQALEAIEDSEGCLQEDLWDCIRLSNLEREMGSSKWMDEPSDISFEEYDKLNNLF